MDPTLAWGLGLFGLSLLLVVVELIVPSGGVIGAVAAVVAIAGDVCLWIGGGPLWGVLGVIVILTGGPAAAYVGINMLTSTPFGRKIMFGEGGQDVAAGVRMKFDEHQHLVDATGEALTDLRPIGRARIGGERHDVLAETDMIRAGTAIRVTSVSGNQIKVRPNDSA